MKHADLIRYEKEGLRGMSVERLENLIEALRAEWRKNFDLEVRLNELQRNLSILQQRITVPCSVCGEVEGSDLRMVCVGCPEGVGE